MDHDSPHGHDIALDPHNANVGTVRGRGMVERSLSQYGAGRSILISADDVALAGNKTLEAAREMGIPVQVIESDGRTLYAIKRTDLPYDDPRARELAIADNRASEVGLDWSAEVIASFIDEGMDLEQFWFPDELAGLLDTVDAPPSLDELAEQYGDHDESAFWPEIRVKVSPDTYERYEVIMADIDAPNPADKIARMLEVVNVAALR